jgi:hypothetical protein
VSVGEFTGTAGLLVSEVRQVVEHGGERGERRVGLGVLGVLRTAADPAVGGVGELHLGAQLHAGPPQRAQRLVLARVQGRQVDPAREQRHARSSPSLGRYRPAAPAAPVSAAPHGAGPAQLPLRWQTIKTCE